jgi:hypothetical protein
VEFAVSNFLAAADQKLVSQDTNMLNQIIEKEYQQRGPDFYKSPTGELLLRKSRSSIREDIRREYARIEAQKKATEFMEQLFDLKPAGPDNLEKLAAATDIRSRSRLPLPSSKNLPALMPPTASPVRCLDLPPRNRSLTRRSTDQSVYVIGFKARHPSMQPPLEQVLDRVTADYQKSQARILANTAGTDLQRRLSEALTQGKSFETVAAEANVEVIDLPPFSQKTQSLAELRGQAELGAIKNVAFALSPAQLSSYNPSRDGGFILYLESACP